jgi:hypothetical protein
VTLVAGKGDGGRPRAARPGGPVTKVKVSGPIDRRDAEALRLAIRRLAERHNVTIGEIRVARRSTRSRRRGA